MDTIQQKFFFIIFISNAFIYACLYTIIIYTYRVYVCTSNQKKSTVWRNRLYVLLYFIPNTFACKSVFNFVKILSSYIILTLHIDIEYLDTPCFVSFVFLFCSHQLFSDLALSRLKPGYFRFQSTLVKVMNFVHYFVTFIESRPQSVLDTGEPLSDPVILMHDIDLINNMQLHELTDS